MPNISEEGRRSPSHSTLACYMCRKRKIKCGRELPHCTICKETSQECSYPAKPLRPGPKIGSTHASSQKRQCKACDVPLSMIMLTLNVKWRGRARRKALARNETFGLSHQERRKGRLWAKARPPLPHPWLLKALQDQTMY